MNRKIKFAISGLILAILILAIINFQLHKPQREIIKPPPAILKIDGEEQISGIGSYCWNGEFSSNGVFSSVCVDYPGIPTVSEPLTANSKFTMYLSLPLKEPPQELQLKVVQVTDRDILETGAGDLRFWRSSDGKYFILPLESEQYVNLSLESGLYLLEVFPRWKEKGSVAYGFLLKVQ